MEESITDIHRKCVLLIRTAAYRRAECYTIDEEVGLCNLNFEFYTNSVAGCKHDISYARCLQLAQMHYKLLLASIKRQAEERRIVMNDLHGVNPEAMKWYFITIGYDDKIVTPHLINKYCQRVIESNYLTEVRYVNERYRKDLSGNIYIHHHTHILALSELAKSRIIDRVYSTVKTIVGNKSFIDVKGYKDKNVGTYQSYQKYINGDKTESKLECVRLDREWRIKENII